MGIGMEGPCARDSWPLCSGRELGAGGRSDGVRRVATALPTCAPRELSDTRDWARVRSSCMPKLALGDLRRVCSPERKIVAEGYSVVAEATGERRFCVESSEDWVWVR